MTENLFNLKSTLGIFHTGFSGNRIKSSHCQQRPGEKEIAQCRRYPAHCCQQKPQPFEQFRLCWTEALQTVSKQIISLQPHLSCSGQGHLDAKALCPGRLALMSTYDTLMQSHLKAASRQERQGVSQISQIQPHSHSPEDLPSCGSVYPLTAYPALCIYCNDHIY